jgi:hypothetical protein
MYTTILETIEASLEAQLTAVRSLREAHCRPRPAKREPKKAQLAVVEEVLRQAGCPLHVSEILRRAPALCGRELDRDSLVSSLCKKILRKELFERVAPNTFALRQEFTREEPSHVAA